MEVHQCGSTGTYQPFFLLSLSSMVEPAGPLVVSCLGVPLVRLVPLVCCSYRLEAPFEPDLPTDPTALLSFVSIRFHVSSLALLSYKLSLVVPMNFYSSWRLHDPCFLSWSAPDRSLRLPMVGFVWGIFLSMDVSFFASCSPCVSYTTIPLLLMPLQFLPMT